MSEENSQKAEGGHSKFSLRPRGTEGQIPNSPSDPEGPRGKFQIECPFCHGTDVELFSLFGSQLLTSEYYCRNCRTVFEHLTR